MSALGLLSFGLCLSALLPNHPVHPLLAEAELWRWHWWASAQYRVSYHHSNNGLHMLQQSHRRRWPCIRQEMCSCAVLVGPYAVIHVHGKHTFRGGAPGTLIEIHTRYSLFQPLSRYPFYFYMRRRRVSKQAQRP